MFWAFNSVFGSLLLFFGTGIVVLFLIILEDSILLKLLAKTRLYFLYHGILGFYIFIFPLGRYGKNLLAKSFGNVMIAIHGFYSSAIRECKSTIFADFQRQNEWTEAKTILEVGIGSGINFEYYPKSCSLIAVDGYELYKERILKSLKPYPGIRLKNFMALGVENMGKIEDGSIDAVVTTIAMCYVPDQRKALEEIFRVLKPGGKYYFCEHVLDKEGTLIWMVQKFLLGIGIWQYLSCGCQTFQHPHLLYETGFSSVECSYKTLKFQIWSVLAALGANHVYGVATK